MNAARKAARKPARRKTARGAPEGVPLWLGWLDPGDHLHADRPAGSLDGEGFTILTRWPQPHEHGLVVALLRQQERGTTSPMKFGARMLSGIERYVVPDEQVAGGERQLAEQEARAEDEQRKLDEQADAAERGEDA